MRITLFDFQKDALNALRSKLLAARTYASSDNPQAIAFSAPTGSGKTVMMTALFEALLVQPDDQLEWPADWAPQSDAVILWLSDMPELNEQTRLKIERQSDRVNRVQQLVSIDSGFDAPRLGGGRIYFMNTQKLGTDKRLTKEGDGRQYSIWTTISNTARAIPDRFYVVIDEAHRGMAGGKGAKDAQSLIQRFLKGHAPDGLIKMPLVIGISATTRRFVDTVTNAASGHTVHHVQIRPEDVRQSGLLKDRILIHHPEASTSAAMSLLEEAARRWATMTDLWDKFCKEEGEPVVRPVLVVQVENATEQQLTKTSLSDALSVVESAIGRRLADGEIAHAMHETGDLDIGGRRVRRVEASRIDEDKTIGVVFFKTSLSTGWDCPRAEVMMSFRHAQDHTYIAQLLGRMVRTPLARRIERDAVLNDVHLFVPYFDRESVKSVIAALQSAEDIPPLEIGLSRDLVTLYQRRGSEKLFDAMSELVTYRVNAARAQSALRRYIGLARGLTIDEVHDEAWSSCKNQIVGWMGELVAALRESARFGAASRLVTHIGLKATAVKHGTGIAEPVGDYGIEVSDLDIDRQYEEAGRGLSNGLHMAYWQAHGDRDAFDVKVEAIVLSKDLESMARLQALAEAEFNRLYDLHKRSVSRLREHRRAYYDKLRLATATPSEILWHLPQSIDWRRSADAVAIERHLYVETDGTFSAALGSWEAAVLQEELSNDAMVGWLRNVDRTPWSLEIPYETGGQVRPMFPDLLVVRKQGKEFLFDILEPHDPSLGDNFEKAVGLARFAERHGHLFGRIQLIRKQPSPAGGVHFARLDMNTEAVRKQVLLISGNPQLDSIFARAAT